MSEIVADFETLCRQKPEIVALARPYYSEEMAYHNFEGHIAGTWESARKIASVCLEQSIEVNISVVDASVLFHDANVHKPLIARYKTPERWSAAISRQKLTDIGYSNLEVKHISNNIIETTQGVKPTTIEGAITKRADIINIGQDYTEFIVNSIKILKETIKKGNIELSKTSVDNWLQTTGAILLGQLRDDEPFGAFDLSHVDDSCSVFKFNGLQNIARFAHENYSSIMERLQSVDHNSNL
jgi:HD superfamily phosphodiesterase